MPLKSINLKERKKKTNILEFKINLKFDDGWILASEFLFQKILMFHFIRDVQKFPAKN